MVNLKKSFFQSFAGQHERPFVAKWNEPMIRRFCGGGL